MGLQVKKDIFLIPYWIKKVLERNELPLTAVLDLNSLSEVVGSEDLALIALLNKTAEQYLGFSIVDADALFMNWHKTSESQQKYFNHVEPLFPMVKETLVNRLFTETAKEEQLTNPFEIKDIDTNTFLVVIYPGYFGCKECVQSQSELVRQLLKLFHAYEGFDSMAKRQLFQKYMSTLTV